MGNKEVDAWKALWGLDELTEEERQVFANEPDEDEEEEEFEEDTAENIRKAESTARILVHGDISSLQGMLSTKKIEVVEVDDDNHILIIPQCRVRQEAVKKKYLTTGEEYPNLTEYVESDDESLSDTVTRGIAIILTGKLKAVDQKQDPKPYDYEAEGKIRTYSDTFITTVNLIGSGEVDVTEYYRFVEYMLRAGLVSNLPNEKKETQQPTP